MVDIALSDDEYVIQVSTEPIAVVELGSPQGPSGAIALADHVANPDPHPQYVSDSDLTAGLATKDTIGTAAQALSSHLAAFPHGDFTTDAEVNLLIAASIAQLTTTIATLQTAIDGKANQNHTQAISTVTGLSNALDNKAATNDSRLSDQRTPIDASVTNAKVASNAAIDWTKISKSGANPSEVGAATAAQGTLANTALQPGAIGVSVQGYRSVLDTIDPTAFATVSQGLLAATALQPGTAIVNILGLQTNLNAKANTADLGSAAFVSSLSFAAASHTQDWASISATPTTLLGYGITDGATAAQGTKADSAVQPGQIAGFVATSDARLSDQRTPIDSSVTNAKVASNAAIDWTKISKSGAVASDVGAATTAQGILAGTALQPGTAISNVSGLQSALDLKQNISGLGSAAFVATSTFATAAQGTLAGTALQPGTIGVSVQGYDSDLAAIGALTPSSGSFLKFVSGAWIAQALLATDIPGLDAAKITSGVFANSQINWAAPGAIGSITPSTAVFTTAKVQVSAADASLDLVGDAGRLRQIRYYSGSLARWVGFVSNEAESGSDAGSRWILSYYTDAGAYKGDALQINRVTGGLTLPNAATFSNGFTANNAVTFTGAIASKNINSTGTRIGLAPTSAPAGGGFRYDYTAGASIPLVSVGPSSNIQFGHGTSGVASAGLWNSGGSLALQYDVVSSAAQGNVLIGTATNNGVDKLQVAGSIALTGALRHTGTTLGFFSATAAAKPTVTGSRGANAALASLITALSTLGLITDTTT